MEQKQFVPGNLADLKMVSELSTLEKEIPSCSVRLLTKDFESIRMEFSQSKIHLVLISRLKQVH